MTRRPLFEIRRVQSKTIIRSQQNEGVIAMNKYDKPNEELGSKDTGYDIDIENLFLSNIIQQVTLAR